MPNPSDRSHVYVGNVENPDVPGTTFDVYQLYDASANRVLEWRVNSDDLSGNMIPGTLRDLGAPSRFTIAQAPASSASVAAPGSTANIARGITSDARHIYISRDANGDRWGLTDENGNRIDWLVNFGDPSGKVISGTVRNLGPVSAAPLPPPPPPNQSNAGAVSNGNTGTQNAGGPGGVGTAPPPPPNTVSNLPIGPQTDRRHTYVSRDTNGDKWRLVDEGGNVVEWYTLPGNASGVPIPGSQKYISIGTQPPATGTGTTGTSGTTGTGGNAAAPAPASAGIGLVTVAGVLLSLLNK